MNQEPSRLQKQIRRFDQTEIWNQEAHTFTIITLSPFDISVHIYTYLTDVSGTFSGYRTGLAGLSIKRDCLKIPLNLTACSSLIKNLSDKNKVANERHAFQVYILLSSVKIYCEIKSYSKLNRCTLKKAYIRSGTKMTQQDPNF